MAIDYDELFKKEAFKNIEPERLEAFRQLAEKISGKNMNEILDILLDFGRNMPGGRNLSNDEKKAIIETITESLSDEEKKKFKTMLGMIEKFM